MRRPDQIPAPATKFRLNALAVSHATLAQLVERNLAKVEVTSSNLVCRSNLKSCHHALNGDYGRGMEQPGSSSGS